MKTMLSRLCTHCTNIQPWTLWDSSAIGILVKFPRENRRSCRRAKHAWRLVNDLARCLPHK
jgi:hypothetical protein